jgi:hypothetical protein
MYLSDKKWTLPSSVVVLKIWTFKNHHFSTISNQVNPTLKYVCIILEILPKRAVTSPLAIVNLV